MRKHYKSNFLHIYIFSKLFQIIKFFNTKVYLDPFIHLKVIYLKQQNIIIISQIVLSLFSVGFRA